MKTTTRTKLASAALALALAMTACGSAKPEVTVADTAQTTETQAAETQATQTQAEEAGTTAAAAPPEASDDSEATATNEAASTGASAGVGERRAVVMVDGEEMTFELLQCADVLGNFYAGGFGTDGTSPDTELQLAWEIPFPGDGDEDSLTNTFAITVDGTNTWKAGTKQGDIGAGTWGSLDWARDGDVLTGTATLEHSWGSTPGPDREASFVVSCS